MNRIIGRITLITATAACALAAVAGTASADTDSFLDSLANLGYPQQAPLREPAINLGVAICHDLATGSSHVDVMNTLESRPTAWTPDKSAAFLVAATDDLCPEYR